MAYAKDEAGQIWEVDGSGNPVRRIGGGQQMPMKPSFPYEGPQAAANVDQTAASAARARQQMGQDAALFGPKRREAEAAAAIKELQLRQARLEQESKDPFNPQALQAIQTDAMDKLQTIGRIGRNYKDSWLPAIGTGAETVKNWIGGTAASDIEADAGKLKAGGALTEVLKMTQATGKNPFTPMSNSDVDLIARNTGNLAQTQSPENFFANLKSYKDAYKNAYAGSVGMQTLKAEIDRLLPSIPPNKREQFRADALRRYNQNMASRRSPPRKPATRSRVIDFNDLPER